MRDEVYIRDIILNVKLSYKDVAKETNEQYNKQMDIPESIINMYYQDDTITELMGIAFNYTDINTELLEAIHEIVLEELDFREKAYAKKLGDKK